MRSLLPLLAASLFLAGCGEGVKTDKFGNSADVDPGPDVVQPGVVPVRVGELGPSFDACNSVGRPNHLDSAAGGTLDVRAAPSDAADRTDSLHADAQFFVCTRSVDQRWLGIVYDPSGTLSPACGVSHPLASRTAYRGPCRSGWVQGAFVRQTAD